jgi:hypothetical protein
MTKKHLIIFICSIFMTAAANSQVKLFESPPLHYTSYRTTGPLNLDGKLDEPDWQKVPWSEDFGDIEGPSVAAPHYRTRMKMLWDDNYLYIAAELEEPHIWATFTERESIIFHENNFEVFIDPSGDSHNYFELEINALGTIWDLMLTKPYRNGGLPINAWDIRGFKYGIELRGTINDPSDTDEGWTVEMALPWNILKETAPWKRPPVSGEYWRINFSRVQWRLEVVDGTYSKIINPETGKAFPEYNWVWSPQWAIDMHRPEYWGYVYFSGATAGSKSEIFTIGEDERIKFYLRELYYLQMQYHARHGKFARSLKKLNPAIPEGFNPPKIEFDTAKNRFSLSAKTEKGRLNISEDGRIRKSL